jgi:hypothetical protein
VILDISENVILNAKHGAIGHQTDSLQHLMPLDPAAVQLMHEKQSQPGCAF